jgi:hypothetical protein
LFTKSGSGLGINLGTQIMENFGLEIGYTHFSSSSTTDTYRSFWRGVSFTDNFKAKHRNIYFDALGYLPIQENIDIIGLVGFGNINSKITETYSSYVIEGKFRKGGIRLGAGARYMFNQNIGSRFLVSYQKGNQILENVTSAGLGLFYQF